MVLSVLCLAPKQKCTANLAIKTNSTQMTLKTKGISQHYCKPFYEYLLGEISCNIPLQYSGFVIKLLIKDASGHFVKYSVK